MKKLFVIVFAIMMAQTMRSQDVSTEPYLTADDLPNAVVWLPEPPDTIGALFTHDIMQYMWGKSIRDTQRGKEAADHWVTSAEEMAKFYSVPFGMTLSEEETPAIYKLMSRVIPTFLLSVTKPKEVYGRKRPYVRFNEPTGIPWDEEREYNTGSYPSGHTIRGWGLALVLCEINPERQDDLLKLGYEWGQSRVIAGYHWQSDVDASRLLAAGVFARLHTCPEYLADLVAAQEEFKRLKGETDDINSVKIVPHPAAQRHSYTVSGIPANDTYRGIIIEDGQKHIRR